MVILYFFPETPPCSENSARVPEITALGDTRIIEVASESSSVSIAETTALSRLVSPGSLALKSKPTPGKLSVDCLTILNIDLRLESLVARRRSSRPYQPEFYRFFPRTRQSLPVSDWGSATWPEIFPSDLPVCPTFSLPYLLALCLVLPCSFSFYLDS